MSRRLARLVRNLRRSFHFAERRWGTFWKSLRKRNDLCQQDFTFDREAIRQTYLHLPQKKGLVRGNGKLATQLYEGYEGQILVNGEPASAWDVEQVQKRIGVVFQDFVQYEMTVRNNIGLGIQPCLRRMTSCWRRAIGPASASSFENCQNSSTRSSGTGWSTASNCRAPVAADRHRAGLRPRGRSVRAGRAELGA